MFATCLHCHSALGTNELIEHFPVGRRLAFDSAKGRLWVVCRKCHRWNLTPLEERWEAIEECERLYSGTPLRASTDNIGLARLADGMDVVRIGAPKTPEMAAWRYARDYGRRWLQNGIPLALMAGGGLQGLQFSMNAANPELYAAAMVAIGACAAIVRLGGRSVRVAMPTGRVQTLPRLLLRHVRLEPWEEGWALSTGGDLPTIIRGGPEIPALRSITTARNFAGAPKREVESAIALLAEARDPHRFITRLARASQKTGIRNYPPDVALALEMALHEGTERRALEGELESLRDEWELAEEVANIADNILLPESVRARLVSMKARADA